MRTSGNAQGKRERERERERERFLTGRFRGATFSTVRGGSAGWSCRALAAKGDYVRRM